VRRVRDVGEHEGSISSQGFWEDGGKGGECIIGADCDARGSTISEEENSSDGSNVILDISGNIPLVEPVLLNAPSVGQTGCVEDANLGARSHISFLFIRSITYHYTVVTRKFVKTARVGLTLVVTIILLIGAVEGAKVVFMDAIPGQDIGDKFQS